ncbi:PAS domain S-box protein [Halomicrobium sp. HM KBTZ05]|uniref:PAS domain S-box protein n=2 Tax=Halomicrobium TaxID=203135 RepID=UPI00355716AA
MSRSAEQLVGALFNVLGSEGYTEVQQLLLSTYQSNASTDRDELVDQLVVDLVTVLREHLSTEEEIEVLTTTIEYLVSRFVSVVEVAPVAIVVVDNEGAIQLWNAGAESMFGWTESEVVGRPYLQTVADTPETVESWCRRLEAGEQFTGVETRHRDSDGAILDVRVWAGPLYTNDDQFTGATFVTTDITEQKTREQRLSVLNRVLRHNIRNDVTVMRGHLEVLAEAVPEESDHVNAIERRIDNITELSERARHIEQLRDCGSEEDWTTFELSSILDDNRERLELDWPTATVTTTGPTATVVRGHELLPYAVENLLENAVEHNDGDDPSVHVEVSRKPRDPAHDVSLAIADDGPGLPAVERDVLTQDTERALSHSSGMGLWLTRWIVRSSGGDLRVEESRFGGTRVVVGLHQPADIEGPE